MLLSFFVGPANIEIRKKNFSEIDTVAPGIAKPGRNPEDGFSGRV